MYFLVDDQVRYQTVFENHKMFMGFVWHETSHSQSKSSVRVTLIISILNVGVIYGCRYIFFLFDVMNVVNVTL